MVKESKWDRWERLLKDKIRRLFPNTKLEFQTAYKEVEYFPGRRRLSGYTWVSLREFPMEKIYQYGVGLIAEYETRKIRKDEYTVVKGNRFSGEVSRIVSNLLLIDIIIVRDADYVEPFRKLAEKYDATLTLEPFDFEA